MRAVSVVTLMVSGALIVGACAGGESETERQARMEQAQRDSVAMADSMFDASVFDTLTWESPEARLQRGGVVYRASCEKCHGPEGRGGGEYAVQMELEVPSLAADAMEVEAIRRGTFVGHEGAMPEWGLVGLKYRDIDAAAAYITRVLGGQQQ